MEKAQDYILTAEHLSIGYLPGNIVQQELNFSLRRAEMTCLLGANGIGKSTLLKTLSSFQAPISGTIRLNGKDLQAFSSKELSHHISIVLTDKMQVGGLTAAELTALGRQPYTGFWGRLSPKDKACIEKAMDRVGILHKANCYMAELSDGERQKVMIAKALAQECPLIILDEPTAFLDMANRIEVMSLLHRLARDEKKSILLSTHDVEQALSLSDNLWLLSAAGMVAGVTAEVIRKGEMDHLFPTLRFDRQRGCYALCDSPEQD